MSIVRYNPSDFVPVSFRNLLTPFLGDLEKGDVTDLFVPRADTVETPTSFLIRLEIPGVKKDDFKVELHGDILTVSGKREREILKKEDTNYHLLETLSGTFSRSFTIPNNVVETGKIKAEYNNGILELVIPKTTKEIKKSTLIEVV